MSIQAQILELLRRLSKDHGTSVILVTHDMGVVAETADRVAVLYAGRVAETGPVADVLLRPTHPYTRGLLGSIPSMEHKLARLPQIPGSMPGLTSIPDGCAFNPRCPRSTEVCRRVRPEAHVAGARRVFCHFAAELAS